MKKLPLTTLTILWFSFFCQAQQQEDQLKTIVDTTYQINQDAIGIMVHVESPGKDLSWSYATGFSDNLTKEKLGKNQPVLIASNTKTYVSAAILKLVENERLNLDDPINKLIRRKTCRLLENNGYKTKEITVRNLLSHTSGITDYVNDDYWKYVNANPTFQWTREKQINLAMELSNPIQAGKDFSYGDINYLLLTEIIEKKCKKQFFVATRSLLAFENNSINSTWFETLEEKPTDLELAHQYAEDKNWDSYQLNPSWDLFGGGGLASTTKDVARFYYLLFNGKIVKDKEVLAEMTKYVLPKERCNNYALGIYNIPSFFGTNVYYHGGWWGTDAMYIPEIDTSIAVFILKKEKRDLSIAIGRAIMELLM